MSSSKTIYNFSAGPAALPKEVMDIIQNEWYNVRHSEMSILEISHRSSFFMDILDEAIGLLRELMHIPEDYEVIFMQGGASAQFALTAMNLSVNNHALFVDTGVWSSKAIQEAQKTTTVETIASSADRNYNYIPSIENIKLNPKADYIHITTNNTIYGTTYTSIPDAGNIPIVADMSSDILSKHYDISKFGMIYAGAQKNLGPSGLALCIIRKDLLDRSKDTIPNIFNYKKIAQNNSLYNTPNTFAIYTCGLVLNWLKNIGGTSAMHEINTQKAQLLYNYLDQSTIFSNPVHHPDRSIMNIPFTTGSKVLDDAFIELADKEGFKQLKGHRTTGGMRASIYNAMPLAGVEKLVEFMQYFEENEVEKYLTE